MKKQDKYKILKMEILSLIVIVTLNININVKSYNDTKEQTIEFENNNDDLIKLYNEYISEVANYYKNKYDNPFDICNEFSLMTYNGLLSYGDNFDTSSPEFDIINYSGLDVINGKGVCRNINCLFTEILKKIGYDCGNVYGTLNAKGEYEIKANHVVTWVDIDNDIYLLDPINASILKKEHLMYKNEYGSTFIPSMIFTKKMNEKLNYKILFSGDTDNIDYSNIEDLNIEENILDCYCFEKNKLENIEKQIVLKLETLQ